MRIWNEIRWLVEKFFDIDEFSTIILGSTIIIVSSYNSSHAEFKTELFQDNDISIIIILTEGLILETHFSHF